jgi:hypothetical protein
LSNSGELLLGDLGEGLVGGREDREGALPLQGLHQLRRLDGRDERLELLGGDGRVHDVLFGLFRALGRPEAGDAEDGSESQHGGE